MTTLSQFSPDIVTVFRPLSALYCIDIEALVSSRVVVLHPHLMVVGHRHDHHQWRWLRSRFGLAAPVTGQT